MDDLPELPFEKVLSYLNLEDRLKARAVSRRWYHKINSFRVSSLCYAGRPMGFIEEKRRLVSGAFACNFNFSTKLASFFNTFGMTILSNLKQLRLCNLDLDELTTAAFAPTLNSFGQLEELTIIRFNLPYSLSERRFKLKLPMLTSLQLERVNRIGLLALDAPRLRKIRLMVCHELNLMIVHGESVERLFITPFPNIEVQNLKNLRYLYLGIQLTFDPTILSGLNQLKEVHTVHPLYISDLFEQKQRYGLTDLKIYLCGLLLNGPDDPAIGSIPLRSKEVPVQLAENPSRVADEIPYIYELNYWTIDRVVDPEMAIDLVSRFTDLSYISVNRPVQDIERLLNILKKFNIAQLSFWGDHPQDLFDRLPENSAIQKLDIPGAPPGLQFLRALEHLNELSVGCSMDIQMIRTLFDELPFLSSLRFMYNNKRAAIRVVRDSEWARPERFEVWCDPNGTKVPDLEAAIQFLVQSGPQENAQPQ